MPERGAHLRVEPDRQIRFVDDFAENVRRYTLGPPLTKVVDKKVGY